MCPSTSGLALRQLCPPKSNALGFIHKQVQGNFQTKVVSFLLNPSSITSTKSERNIKKTATTGSRDLSRIHPRSETRRSQKTETLCAFHR